MSHGSLHVYLPCILLSVFPFVIIEMVTLSFYYVLRYVRRRCVKLLSLFLICCIAVGLGVANHYLYALSIVLMHGKEETIVTMAGALLLSISVVNPLICIITLISGIVAVIICRKQRKPILLPLCLGFIPPIILGIYTISKLP
jgi:hypothetical protein